MGAIKTWAPIVSGLVLVLRTLGFQDIADLIDSTGVNVIASLGFLAGVAMKGWAIYQKRKGQ